MPNLEIVRRESVGEDTVALALESPPEFEAYPGQFVLLRATIDDVEETGYYTISSPDVDGEFEITVGVAPEGTLGPWLAARSPGDSVTVEGPFGDVTYRGDGDAVVFAGGPGIGPAVGIAERARAAGHAAAIVFEGESPPHAARLDAFDADGATVRVVDDVADAVADVDLSAGLYAFGFRGFIESTRDALEAAGVDTDADDVGMESFGPA